MNENFDSLPPVPQPEQEKSISEKLRRLGGPENPEFLEVFGRWQDELRSIADSINTPRANIEMLLATAKMKADLGLSEAALDDVHDILDQIYYSEDYADLGGEANNLMNSLGKADTPIE